LRGSGQASGKVILLGEHAVVYGRPALALPVRNAITASVYEHDSEIRLTIPAWNIDQSMSPAESVADGTAPLLKFLIRALGVEAETMRIDVDARIPPAIGLGSSAALAVALIRAISKSFAIELSDADINKLAFDCEKLAHGTPSGIDNTLAVYGRPIVFQSAGAKSIRELALRENPPLVIASSGSRGSTREQVDGIRWRRKESQDAYERIFDEIGRVSIEGSEALVKGDFAGLGALMNINQGLLNALGVSTPLLEELIDIARSSGALGAKLTGAGGGGSVVALCPGKVREVSLAFESAGFDIIDAAAQTGATDERE
jgi:hydroxymethylglutaryl-CoA reductase